MVLRVDEIYKQIFGNDPLLLEEENQRTFGAQILENLLVERGIKSALPHPVSLGSASSRASFRRSDEPGPDPVDEGLKQRYLSSVRSRKQLDAEDVETLKTVTMVTQANFTAERAKKEVFSDHDDATNEMKGTGSPLEKRLRIAAIGYRVSISRLEDSGLLDEELCPMPPKRDNGPLNDLAENKSVEKLRRTKLRSRDKQPSWHRAISDHIKRALGRKSHVVVLPEFSLPPNLTSKEVEQAISDVAAKFEHPYFLFSGTRHEGAYNRGFIVSHASGKEKPSDRWWHYKTASARGLGENVMGPQNARIPSYKFSLLSPLNDRDPLEYRMFVPVCYDIFDPTTFINYVAGCAEADGHFYQSIILVPSFNPGREFVHALRDLSFIAACPVIYVNGLHGDAKLFLYGIAVSDLADIEVKAAAAGQPRARADQSIEDAITKLKFEHDAAASDYKTLDEIVDYDPHLHESIEERRIYLSERRRALKGRLDALRELSTDLDEMRSRGALKHLMTTEACSDCAKENHGSVDYCSRDIVYYNLDPNLLEVLNKFRNSYFGKEEFLPSPFRQDGKKRIRAMIKEQNDQRQRARAQRIRQR